MPQGNLDRIQLERRPPVCSIILDNPLLNIIDLQMMEEIQAALHQIEEDPEIRIVVFRGSGERAFSSGVSIQDHTPDKIAEMIPRFHAIFRLLSRTEKITVAAVHGLCLGGGCELALMCDLVVAAENAQFGQPEIKLGQLPPVCVILLPYLAGYRAAAELILTGKTIGAREAQALGLINRIAPDGQLSESVDQLLNELSTQSGTALRLSKKILRRLSGVDFEEALRQSEEFFLDMLAPTHDAQEGILAFLEKRAPRWRDRG